jgi:hypothetical protein
MSNSAQSVAVGTTITDRPPHRTVRAALPHTAPTSEAWRAGCYSHTVQSLGLSFPALCRASAELNGVLLDPRPSLPRLRRRSLFFVRLVHRYYGAVRLQMVLRLSQFPRAAGMTWTCREKRFGKGLTGIASYKPAWYRNPPLIAQQAALGRLGLQLQSGRTRPPG